METHFRLFPLHTLISVRVCVEQPRDIFHGRQHSTSCRLSARHRRLIINIKIITRSKNMTPISHEMIRRQGGEEQFSQMFGLLLWCCSDSIVWAFKHTVCRLLSVFSVRVCAQCFLDSHYLVVSHRFCGKEGGSWEETPPPSTTTQSKIMYDGTAATGRRWSPPHELHQDDLQFMRVICMKEECTLVHVKPHLEVVHWKALSASKQHGLISIRSGINRVKCPSVTVCCRTKRSLTGRRQIEAEIIHFKTKAGRRAKRKSVTMINHDHDPAQDKGKSD